MPIEYVNRKGQRYYLHAGETKTGKSKYFFSMSESGTPMDTIPPGFEIYENPNGQVFLRKALPKLISDEELEIVEREVRRFAHLKDSRLDRKLEVLTVYVVDQSETLFEDLRLMGEWNGRANIDDVLSRFRTYSPKLQFVLLDSEKRIFQARRYCYRSFVDDWMYIGAPGTIAALTREYIKHLKQDSYYELF